MLLWQEVHYYMVYIAYYTVLNLQICNYAQIRRICRENGKYALDESFYDHFCPRRKAANFCHPSQRIFQYDSKPVFDIEDLFLLRHPILVRKRLAFGVLYLQHLTTSLCTRLSSNQKKEKEEHGSFEVVEIARDLEMWSALTELAATSALM